MNYIVLVAYENDAERKRIDYLLDKWSTKAKIKKLKSMAFFIDTDETQEFLEELFSKLEGRIDEKVKIYQAKEVEKKVEKRRHILQYRIKEEKKVVEKFVGYLLSKMNANYTYSDAMAKVYNVYTRKGGGTIRVILQGNGEMTVVFEIEGYGDVVDFLAEKMDDELKLFAGG